MFLFLKKRKRSNLTNQSPDFNDGHPGNPHDQDEDDLLDRSHDDDGMKYNKFGFAKLFGSKSGSKAASNNNLLGLGSGLTGYKGILDLERQSDFGTNGSGGYGAAIGAGAVAGSASVDTNDDFVYRGVTNSNNLDSVFRSSETSRGTSSFMGKSATGSTTNSSTFGGRTRLNSFAHPLASPEQFNFNEHHEYTGLAYGEHGSDDYLPAKDQGSSDYDNDTDSEFNPSDYDDGGLPGAGTIIEPDRGQIFGNQDHGSNNSQSRFAEDIT